MSQCESQATISYLLCGQAPNPFVLLKLAAAYRTLLGLSVAVVTQQMSGMALKTENAFHAKNKRQLGYSGGRDHLTRFCEAIWRHNFSLS